MATAFGSAQHGPAAQLPAGTFPNVGQGRMRRDHPLGEGIVSRMNPRSHEENNTVATFRRFNFNQQLTTTDNLASWVCFELLSR